ncbi:MAG: hypothetical protein AABW59_00680 [archaeon]
MPRLTKRKLTERKTPILPGFIMPKKVIYTPNQLLQKKQELTTLQNHFNSINNSLTVARNNAAHNEQQARSLAMTGEGKEYLEQAEEFRKEEKRLGTKLSEVQEKAEKERQELQKITNYINSRKTVKQFAQELRARATRILNNKTFVIHTLEAPARKALSKLAQGKRITREELRLIKEASEEYRIIMGD